MIKSLVSILLIIFITTFFVAGLVWAQDEPGVTGTQVDEPGVDTAELDPPVSGTFPQVIGKVIKAFLGIVGTISLVMFVYGGITILTAAGRGPQITKGRNTLIWASLGIIIVFASYAILKFVFSAFGL